MIHSGGSRIGSGILLCANFLGAMPTFFLVKPRPRKSSGIDLAAIEAHLLI